MDIIETSLFTRQIKGLMPDDTYAELQFMLAQYPDLGDIIPGSGGIRKIRWAGSGRGKRGGNRVIYYWHVSKHQILMLLAYAKNEQGNLSQAELKVLRKVVKEEFGDG